MIESDTKSYDFPWSAVGSLIGLLTLGLVDNQILSPIIPDVASSLAVSVGRVGLTVSGYALAAAAAGLVVAPLSDRGARRPFLAVAAVTFTLASLASFFAGTFWVFAGARVVAGAAAGVISALVVASIADRVPYERRGRVMVWVAAAYVAAPILGAAVGSVIVGFWGWRALYLLFAGAAAALAFLVWRSYTDSPSSGKDRRLRASQMLLNYWGFLRSRNTAAGALSAFFVSGGLTAFMTYLGAYLSSEFGLETRTVFLIFLSSGGAALLGALAAGGLSDRVGKRPVALWGSLALAVFILLVPQLGAGITLYAGLALTGLAAASRMAPLQALVTGLVSRDARGAYVALRNTLSQLGIAVAAAVGATLFTVRGYGAVCLLAASFSVIAAVLLRWVEEPRA
ncbi:MAG: MFS transporter [Vicinamibacteria bacterium]